MTTLRTKCKNPTSQTNDKAKKALEKVRAKLIIYLLNYFLGDNEYFAIRRLLTIDGNRKIIPKTHLYLNKNDPQNRIDIEGTDSSGMHGGLKSSKNLQSFYQNQLKPLISTKNDLTLSLNWGQLNASVTTFYEIATERNFMWGSFNYCRLIHNFLLIAIVDLREMKNVLNVRVAKETVFEFNDDESKEFN